LFVCLFFQQVTEDSKEAVTPSPALDLGFPDDDDDGNSPEGCEYIQQFSLSSLTPFLNGQTANFSIGSSNCTGLFIFKIFLKAVCLSSASKL
jgi:hypothetical protein